MPQKYYRLTNILKSNAQYNFLIGERSNGKSYAVKEKALKDAIKKDKIFVLLRRWQLETKTAMIEQYFDDMTTVIEKITNGEYNAIYCYRGEIRLALTDCGTVVAKGNLIGYVAYLSGASHFKSTLQNPKIYNVIYEEVITNEGYLDDEPNRLLNFISTVLRRRNGQVFLIGNTLSRLCPYYRAWGLIKTKTQTQGSIEIYEKVTDQKDDNGDIIVIKIAVEYCENSGNNTKMIFGNKAITHGAFETRPMAKLPKEFRKNYLSVYKVAFHFEDFKYIAEIREIEMLNKNRRQIIFVYPFTGEREPVRVVTDNADEILSSKFASSRLDKLTKGDIMLLYLLDMKAVAYSDDLTGTEFQTIIKKVR